MIISKIPTVQKDSEIFENSGKISKPMKTLSTQHEPQCHFLRFEKVSVKEYGNYIVWFRLSF